MADPREITRLVLPGFGAMWATVLRALRAAGAPEADRAVGADGGQDAAGSGVDRAPAPGSTSGAPSGPARAAVVAAPTSMPSGGTPGVTAARWADRPISR